jgi:hypothetical protein
LQCANQRNLALFPIGDLGKVRTNDAFLFQTPDVRFANPIVPRLAYDSFSLDTMPGATGDLDPLLTLFFKDLYGGGTGTTSADVSMQGLTAMSSSWASRRSRACGCRSTRRRRRRRR